MSVAVSHIPVATDRGRPRSTAGLSSEIVRGDLRVVEELADDWRELMRLYLVRRTRSFICWCARRNNSTRR